MECLCEVLDPEHYFIKSPVAIIEDPHALRKIFPFASKGFLKLYHIDPRLLTACFESHDPHYLRVIVVYDYLHFCSDRELREAIIFHELGHIAHPAEEGEVNADAEIMCDWNAVRHGSGSGVRKMLDLLHELAVSLQIPPLLEVTKARREVFAS